MPAKQEPESIAQHAEVVANAAAEATKPEADTDSKYECPFCVMMRKGGCEEVFKAFMECGEKADKGDQEMVDCLPQFEQLHLCMEKNKAVFDGLLQEMKEEEERSKVEAGTSSSDGAASTAQQGGSEAAAAAGATTHQQEQQVAEASSSSSSSQGNSSSAGVHHAVLPDASRGMAAAI